MTDPVLPLGLPGSWVVLAGTGRHVHGSALPDVPAVTGTVRDLGRVLVERCGVAPERLLTLVDPTPGELHGGLVDAAERATDVLLCYYVGHGLVSSGGELHLATVDTDHIVKALATKALPYSAVRDAVTECPAPWIVVVLDCCFAGRARGSFGTPVADAMELASLGGTYLLASAAREEQALAPAGAGHTAFSGELIRLIREGDPTAPALLTVEDAYRHLSRVLPRRGAPAPYRQLSGRTSELVLAPNPAAPPVVVRRAQVSDESGQPERPSPYRGLDAFAVEDARYFFGRDELTGELVRRIAARSREVGLFAVVGPSGAGKSSLLHAGLLPAVAQGRLSIPGSRTWPRLAMAPGEHPLDTLASRLAEPANEPENFAEVVRRMLRRRAGGSTTTPDGRLLLVVDQFEEIFTACHDDDERAAFITALSAASTPPADGGPAPALVVLGIRADFYGRCLAYPPLLPALEEGQILVTPMSTTQLRAVIEKPAEVAGLHLEDGLTDLLLHDLGSGVGQGDALPLLSYALLSTWQRREGHTLTLAGYRATGGIWDAVTQQADRAYEALDPVGHRAARTMLLRMVRIGDGTEEPRRVDLVDLLAHGPAGEAVLNAFADARLITTDEDTARITHEALLRTWPRLRRWIAEDRAGMLVHQQLTESAETWRRDDRDRGGLYRGTRLAAARQWLTGEDNRADLSELEHEFLRASAHAARRRRLFAVAAVIVLLVATAAGVFAVQQYRIAAERDAVLASQQIAARAEAIRSGDPAAALQLSLAAYRLYRTPETRAALYTSDTTPYAIPLRGHTGKVRHVAFGADGRTLASSDDRGSVRLWDVSNPHRPAAKAVLPVRGATAIALSPTADILAVHAERSLQLWDIANPEGPYRTGSVRADMNAARVMTFSADGTTLAVGGGHDVSLWHVTDTARPAPGTTVSADTRQVTSVAVHPTGHALATVSDGGAVRLWNLTTPTPTVDTTFQILSARGVVFSSDGNTIAIGGADGKLHVWDVTNPRAPGPVESALSTTQSYEPLPDKGNIRAVAFSPDGRTVAAAGETGVVSRAVISGQVGSPDYSWRELPSLGDPNLAAGVNTIAFSEDNLSLATGGDDRTVRIWTTPGPPPIADHMNNPLRVGTGFGAEGRTLVTGEWAGTDKTRGARLWDLTDPRRPKPVASLPAPWGHAGFLTDGRTLLAEDNTTYAASLWDAGDPRRPTLQAAIPTGSDPQAGLDNHVVMTNSAQDGTVELWDVTNPERPVRAGSVSSTANLELARGGLILFGLLNNGRLVGSFDTDYVPLIWDISDPHHPGDPVRLSDDERSAPPRTQGGPLGDFGDDLLMEVIKERHIKIWDVADPQHPEVKTTIPLAVNDAEVIHNGQVLVTWREATRTVGFWNIRDPRHPANLARYVADTTSVELYTSPDGRTVAAKLGSQIGGTSSSGDRIRFWDTSSPDTVLERTGLPSTALRLAFSPDNHTVAAEVYDRGYGTVIRLWEIDTDRLYRQLCATIGNTITPDQWARLIPNRPYQQPCET